MYAYAVQLYTEKKKRLDHFCSCECLKIPKRVADDMEDVWLTVSLFNNLVKILNFLCNNQATPIIVFATEHERQCLQDILIKAIAVDNIIVETIQEAAKQLLLMMFSDGQSLMIDTDDIPELLDYGHLGPKVVIIEDILRENVALPVYGFYELGDIAHYMVSKYITVMTDSDIYEKWESGQKVNDDMFTRAEIYFKVIQRYKGLASNYQRYKQPGVNLFLLSPNQMMPRPTKKFQSPYLGKLYFFKMLEAITACEKKRMERFKGFGSDHDEDKGGIQIQFLGYEEVESPKLKIKSKVGRFFVLTPPNGDNRPLDTLKLTTMLEYILVEDSDEVSSMSRLMLMMLSNHRDTYNACLFIGNRDHYKPSNFLISNIVRKCTPSTCHFSTSTTLTL